MLFFALVGTAGAVESRGESPPDFEIVQVVHVVEPGYPLRSLAVGTVILKVVVDPSDAIDHIFAIQGVPSLTEEAERSVGMWSFQPAKLNGDSVASSIIASFGFSSSFSPSPSWVASTPLEKPSWFEAFGRELWRQPFNKSRLIRAGSPSKQSIGFLLKTYARAPGSVCCRTSS